jgi:3-isopropylmalate/(R)-2-methylmalate dehydratase large subunit
MGKTMIEKIIQAHSDEPVQAGGIVWMGLDARTARDFGGANVVKNYRKHYGDAPVDDPARTFFTFDLVTPANNIPYAINQQICRDWAREQGVRVFDVDHGHRLPRGDRVRADLARAPPLWAPTAT